MIVNYSGWTPDGKMFDSSITRGQPARFGLGGVIKGWTEGVQLMTKGEKARFWIPAALAYGDKPRAWRARRARSSSTSSSSTSSSGRSQPALIKLRAIWEIWISSVPP